MSRWAQFTLDKAGVVQTPEGITSVNHYRMPAEWPPELQEALQRYFRGTAVVAPDPMGGRPWFFYPASGSVYQGADPQRLSWYEIPRDVRTGWMAYTPPGRKPAAASVPDLMAGENKNHKNENELATAPVVQSIDEAKQFEQFVDTTKPLDAETRATALGQAHHLEAARRRVTDALRNLEDVVLGLQTPPKTSWAIGRADEWVDKTGRRIPIVKMTTEHLRNAVLFVMEKPGAGPWHARLPALIRELVRRGQPVMFQGESLPSPLVQEIR